MFAISRALAILFLLHSAAHAAPIVVQRQDNNGVTTLMTQTVTNTSAGEMTQTCIITLTPVTGADGKPAVQEVKQCQVSMASQSNNGSSGTDSGSNSGSNSGDSSSSSTDTSSSTSTDTSSSTATDSSTTASTDSSGSSSTTGTDAAATGAPAVSANGVSTIDVPAATAPPATATTTGATDGNGAGAASATSTDTNGVAQAATAAAENQASSSASAFSVPGQKIQVLPIGLGVFAGISVIALIVVGLVTYERTKYRKAFRARKLAESGAAMGYGGMAQR